MKDRIPFRVRPMLATLVDEPFHKPGWVYEEKYDGYRILAYKEGSQVTLLALPLTAILVLEATPGQVGLLTSLGFAPSLIFGLLAGVWTDRVRRAAGILKSFSLTAEYRYMAILSGQLNDPHRLSLALNYKLVDANLTFGIGYDVGSNFDTFQHEDVTKITVGYKY